MNKQDLARNLARLCHRSPAKAADAVDTLVYRLLKELKTPQQRDERKELVAPPPPSRPRRDS